MACIAKRRGRYVIDCYDQNGKRYRKTMREGATKEDARKELREIEAKIERKTFLHEKKTPQFKDVAQDWIKYKATRCRITTHSTYTGFVANHFQELNDKKINLITTVTVERWITARQLSTMHIVTLRKVLTCLNQIMRYAVRHRLIDFNPVTDAERPKATGDIDNSNKKQFLTRDQIRALIEAEPDQKYRTLFLTAIMTGMRQGELMGLQWRDVDFTDKQIHVQRTYNTYHYFEPKTKSSIRNIDLAQIVVKELAAWKLKTGGKDGDPVFPSNSGTPMDAGHMKRRHYFPALKRAGIPQVRFHDLRHTYASLLIDQGENIKYIQTQLGHSSPMITLSVYAHLMAKTNQDAVSKMENGIFGATGHNVVTNEKNGEILNG